jgi:hypothetical protein
MSTSGRREYGVGLRFFLVGSANYLEWRDRIVIVQDQRDCHPRCRLDYSPGLLHTCTFSISSQVEIAERAIAIAVIGSNALESRVDALKPPLGPDDCLPCACGWFQILGLTQHGRQRRSIGACFVVELRQGFARVWVQNPHA